MNDRDTMYQMLHTAADQQLDMGETVGFTSLIQAAGTVAGALVYAAAFCPPLGDVDGMVIQLLDTYAPDQPGGLSPENIQGVREVVESFNGDRARAQELINHIHIGELFGYRATDLIADEDFAVAESLAASWRAWLHYNYPDRRFTVKVFGAEESEEDERGGVEVSFWEEVAR